MKSNKKCQKKKKSSDYKSNFRITNVIPLFPKPNVYFVSTIFKNQLKIKFYFYHSQTYTAYNFRFILNRNW